MQNAVSRQKQSMTVFGVANAQKQGVIRVECIEASSTTMFQELEQNAELAFPIGEGGPLAVDEVFF